MINVVSNKYKYFDKNKFVKEKLHEKNNCIINKNNCNKKHLTVIACHLHNKQRVQNLYKNLKFLCFPENDIIIVNSSGLSFNNDVKQELADKIKQYIEIPNNNWIDFGKWKYVLENIDYSNYDFITFTNDSFSIFHPVQFYFNLASNQNKEIYAYTSSSEVKYHFQSYLFTIQKEAINKFKHYLQTKIIKYSIRINAIHLELHLIDVFQSRDCFLDIGKINKQNIFFTNNDLYLQLFACKLLPFIKLKRLQIVSREKVSCLIYNKTSTTFSLNPS